MRTHHSLPCALAILACLSGTPAALASATALPLENIRTLRSGKDAGGEFCAGFRLSSRQAACAFARSRVIDQAGWSADYDYLPCWVSGTATLGGEPVRWEFRAGGNATVTRRDGTHRFYGCDRCRDTFGTGQDLCGTPR